MTDDELKELAAQLKQPYGPKGVETGVMLHESNLNMTLNAIRALRLNSHDAVFELGHGNCSHLEELFSFADNLSYQGLKISDVMIAEAIRINQAFVEHKKANFCLYDGCHFPFPNASFDKGFSVNTLYFWESPLNMLREIDRVLKPRGCFAITFGDKSYLEKQPFTRYGFDLYGIEDVEELVKQTQFRVQHIEQQSEMIQSKAGNRVQRIYNTIVIGK